MDCKFKTTQLCSKKNNHFNQGCMGRGNFNGSIVLSRWPIRNKNTRTPKWSEKGLQVLKMSIPQWNLTRAEQICRNQTTFEGFMGNHGESRATATFGRSNHGKSITMVKFIPYPGEGRAVCRQYKPRFPWAVMIWAYIHIQIFSKGQILPAMNLLLCWVLF